MLSFLTARKECPIRIIREIIRRQECRRSYKRRLLSTLHSQNNGFLASNFPDLESFS
jgi:hypothetical protein